MAQILNLGKFRAIGLIPRATPCYSTENAETFVPDDQFRVVYRVHVITYVKPLQIRPFSRLQTAMFGLRTWALKVDCRIQKRLFC